MALGMLICLPGMASADWTLLGSYSTVDNYAYGPLGTTGPAIQEIDYYIAGPVGLNFYGAGVIDTTYGPGFATWSVTTTTPYTVVATNTSPITTASWDYDFTGTGPPQNWELIWDAYSSSTSTPGTFVTGEIVQVIDGVLQAGPTGEGVYFTSGPIIPPTPTPVPPSVLLLGSGLFGLGLLGRRKIFKA